MKNMKGQALVGAMIGLMVALIIGVGVVIPVVSDVLAPATTLTSVTTENITFALNNTAYTLAHTPVDESTNTAKLYYFANTSNRIPAGKVVFTSTTVKIYTNSTLGVYPNITNGTTFYYAYYDYQPSGYVTSSTARTLVGYFVLLIVIVIIVAIVGLIGLGKSE